MASSTSIGKFAAAALAFGAGVLTATLAARKALDEARADAEDARAVADEAAAVSAGSRGLPSGRFTLTGKNTIVTGGGSGIGLAISQLFAEQGAIVHILDLNEEAASAAAVKINSALGRQAAFARGCDVSDRSSVQEAFTAIVLKFGPIDVLVNNAGIGAVGDVLKATEEEMDRLYRVNVKGVFNCSQAAVQNMVASGRGGSIVNLASIASLIGLSERFSYSMSKGAVLTMTYSVATDFVKKGIRCNAVCPARVHTPFVDAYLAKNYAGHEAEKFKELSEYQPIGRMGTPQEIASLILYLASDESKFVTGSAYSIDGGVVCNMG